MRSSSLISAWWFVCVGPLFCPLAGAGEGGHPRGDSLPQVGVDDPFRDEYHGYVDGSTVDLGTPNYLGSRSCASTSCHGGLDDAHLYGRTSGKEFLMWLENDPHTHSLSTLDNAKSQRMIAQLLKRSAESVPLIARRHVLNRCYACHSGQTETSRGGGAEPSWSAAQGQSWSAAQGHDSVSCESCHGPARDWIGEHYQSYWSGLSASDKAARGMVDTANLMRRAQVCVQCHIGSPGRDVDHDLIAAGHPVLKFEFAGYLARLPKHWNGRNERIANLDFEWRA